MDEHPEYIRLVFPCGHTIRNDCLGRLQNACPVLSCNQSLLHPICAHPITLPVFGSIESTKPVEPKCKACQLHEVDQRLNLSGVLNEIGQLKERLAALANKEDQESQKESRMGELKLHAGYASLSAIEAIAERILAC